MKANRIFNVVVFFVVMAFAATFVSCGSSQKVVSSEKGKVKVEKEECEEMAIAPDAKNLRGYGVGVSPDKMFARDIATTSARNEIASAIQSAVSSFLTKFNQQHSNSIGNDRIGKVSQEVRQLVDQSVSNSVIVCSNTYQLKNNDYEVHVCIEMKTDLVENVYNKLKDDDKLKIDFQYEKFKNQFDEELKAYRESK